MLSRQRRSETPASRVHERLVPLPLVRVTELVRRLAYQPPNQSKLDQLAAARYTLASGSAS